MDKSQTLLKKWRFFEGQHQFCFDGKIMYGPKIKNLIFTAAAINICNLFMAIVFCATG